MLARNDFLDFVFIGAGRDEGRWLTRVLGEHPSIAVAPLQSSGGFSAVATGSTASARSIGSTRYREHELERLRRRFNQAGPLSVLGCVEPDLMLDPMAATRLSKAFPAIKLVAFLRDPAALVFDQYVEASRQRRVSPIFAEELAEHPEWIDRALYHRHLLPFLDRFHPDQICLVIHERFFAAELRNLLRLYAYLDVDGEFRPSSRFAECRRHEPDHPFYRQFLGSVTAPMRRGTDRQQQIDMTSRHAILDEVSGDMGRLEHALSINLDIWRGLPSAGTNDEADLIAQSNNVIPLPAGAERRQRLADRRARRDAKA